MLILPSRYVQSLTTFYSLHYYHTGPGHYHFSCWYCSRFLISLPASTLVLLQSFIKKQPESFFWNTSHIMPFLGSKHCGGFWFYPEENPKFSQCPRRCCMCWPRYHSYLSTTPAVHSALAISAFYCFLKTLDLPLSRAFPLAVPSAWNALLLDSLTILDLPWLPTGWD